MEIADLFHKAEKLELVAGEIYDLLAQRVQESAALQEFFETLAREERQHARRIQMLGLRLQGRAAAVPAIPVSATQLDALLSDAAQLKQTCMQAELPAMATLVQLLVQAETRFAQAHAEIMAQAQDAEIKELFVRLSQFDDGHRALLNELASHAHDTTLP